MQFATFLKRAVEIQYVASAGETGLPFCEYERSVRSTITELVLSAPCMNNTIGRVMRCGVWKNKCEQDPSLQLGMLGSP